MEEDEEEDKDEEVGAAGIEGVPEAATEATPLLRASTVSRSLSRSRRRRGSVSGQGTATVTQAVLMVPHISSILEKRKLIFNSEAAQIVHRDGRLIPWKSVRSFHLPFTNLLTTFPDSTMAGFYSHPSCSSSLPSYHFIPSFSSSRRSSSLQVLSEK